MIYAGIGSRKTPMSTLNDMRQLAYWLSFHGWSLRSGGADGADTAFAEGARPGLREIFLPWPDYNDHGESGDNRVIEGSIVEEYLRLAQSVHPAWERCRRGARKLLARNVPIILGASLDAPVDAVICWTANGEPSGGTGSGIRLAQKSGIPVYNLSTLNTPDVRQDLYRLMQDKPLGKDPLPDQPAAAGQVLNKRDGPPPDGSVYIGRPSPWGNPYPMSDENDRETVISRYTDDLKHKIDAGKISKPDLLSLVGKDLVCWCAPKPCHGNVLISAVDWALGNISLPPWETPAPSQPAPQQSLSNQPL